MVRVLTVQSSALHAATARQPGDTNAVPVLGYLPRGARLIASCYDMQKAELHILYDDPPPGPDPVLDEATEAGRAVALAEQPAPISYQNPTKGG